MYYLWLHKIKVMKYIIFDIETDGLLDRVSKIHCVSYRIYNGRNLILQESITTHAEIKALFDLNYTMVGHNIVRFDIPVVEKLLNVKITNRLIDTLGISWYLYPIRDFSHSLEAWGERFKVSKIQIEDWTDLEVKDYIIRCERDVEINTYTFHHQMDYLMDIYKNLDEVNRFLNYLNFKELCLSDHERVGIPLDKRLAEQSKLDLEFIIEDKMSKLSEAMPNNLGKIKRSKPKKMYKQDKTLSALGESWNKQLIELSLPEDTVAIHEKPNPGSHTQLKKWLFSIGWKPINFKISTSKKEPGKKVPQITVDGKLCTSVVMMTKEYPVLWELDNLYKAKHRKGIFEGYIDCVDNKGKIYLTAHGFTNTLRLQHSKPIVNLPQPGKYYGEEVRACLTVPNDDYIMVGADISGLEDNTKQHYIYFFDPQYVEDMRVEGFDPHLDIGLLSGLITEEEVKFYKTFDSEHCTEEENKLYHDIKFRRFKAKTVNFSATYGASPKKMSETLRCPISEAKALHKTYWERNSAIKKVANSCKVKTVKNQKWLYNPVSGFWLFLKAEKDRFSTLNQNTGVFVFDTWLSNVRKRLMFLNIYVSLQYHDEMLLYFKKELKTEVIHHLYEAMKETNTELNLNVSISISVDIGKNYAECH